MVTKVTIDGRFYDQPAKKTAKELGINYSTLKSRINSNSEKYKGWVISELDTDILINGKHFADIDKAILTLLDIKYRVNKIKSLHNKKN